MGNPDKVARLDGSHWVSPFNFTADATEGFDFPTPLGLIDSTLRKARYTAGATIEIDGFLRIAEALDEVGVRDESLNINWFGEKQPVRAEFELARGRPEGELRLHHQRLRRHAAVQRRVRTSHLRHRDGRPAARTRSRGHRTRHRAGAGRRGGGPSTRRTGLGPAVRPGQRAAVHADVRPVGPARLRPDDACGQRRRGPRGGAHRPDGLDQQPASRSDEGVRTGFPAGVAHRGAADDARARRLRPGHGISHRRRQRRGRARCLGQRSLVSMRVRGAGGGRHGARGPVRSRHRYPVGSVDRVVPDGGRRDGRRHPAA